MTRLVAILGVVGISFSAVFVALAGASPSTSAFLRMAMAAPLLFFIAWRQGELRAASPGAVRFALVSGVVFALNITVWHYNIDLLGTGLATVMGNAQVVFIGLVAWLLYGERPTTLALVAVPVMLFAVVMTSGLIGGSAAVAQPLLGAALGVATAVLNAAWFLLFREATRRVRRPAGVLAYLTGAAALTSLAVSFTDPGFGLQLSASAFGWLLALAVSAQVVGWLFISPALSRLPALEVAVLMLLQPTLTLGWGALFFGEAHSPWQWAGVVGLLACVAVVNRYGGVRPAAAQARSSPTVAAPGGDD